MSDRLRESPIGSTNGQKVEKNNDKRMKDDLARQVRLVGSSNGVKAETFTDGVKAKSRNKLWREVEIWLCSVDLFFGILQVPFGIQSISVSYQV